LRRSPASNFASRPPAPEYLFDADMMPFYSRQARDRMSKQRTPTYACAAPENSFDQIFFFILMMIVQGMLANKHSSL
jgi:hypothetical protein